MSKTIKLELEFPIDTIVTKKLATINERGIVTSYRVYTGGTIVYWVVWEGLNKETDHYANELIELTNS